MPTPVQQCFVCNEIADENKHLTACSQNSYERMKSYASAWSIHGFFTELNEKLSATGLTIDKIFYHGRCYNKLTHKNNLSKVQKRQEETPADTRSCIICQGARKGIASKVSSERVAEQILQLKSTSTTALKDRLLDYHTKTDILENGICYHSACLLNEKKNAIKRGDDSEPIESVDGIESIELIGGSESIELIGGSESFESVGGSESIEDAMGKVAHDFLSAVKRELNAMATIDMNQLARRYKTLCDNANLNHPAMVKPYIRNLIKSDEELMAAADFYQHAPNKPAVLANKKIVSKLVCEKHFREDDENYCDSFGDVSKVIRKELAVMKHWEFNGTFDDFEMPTRLSELIKAIISDNKSVSEVKQKQIDAVTRNIVQFIYSNFKSDRQLNYYSLVNRGFEKHRPTPLSVGIALVNYKDIRSKKEIDFFSAMGLSINYDRLERILTSLATTSVDIATQNNMGVILPSCFKKGLRPIFAADNIDIGGDVSSFHGADLMIAQREDTSCESLFPVCKL